MKNKLLAWALVLAMLLALMPGALADSAVSYVALGDELSLGTEQTLSFPQLLADRQGWDLDNRAAAGMTAQGLLDQLQRDEDVIRTVRSAKVITVTIGLNDLLAACLEQYARYMELDENPETVDELQEQGILWLLGQGNSSGALMENLVRLCGALEQSQAESALDACIQDFAQKWSSIAARLLDLNPKAQIFVLESYNPYGSFTDYEDSGIYVGKVMEYWTGQLLSAVSRERHCGKDYLAVDCSEAEGSASISLNALLNAPVEEVDVLFSLLDLNYIPTQQGFETMTEAVLRARSVQELRQLSPQEEAELPFSDVTAEDDFYPAIQRVYSTGLMEGVSATRFDPQGNLTRAMVVTILYRMESEPAVRWSAPFADVQTDLWYSNAVQWAWDCGIAQGSGGSFEPNDLVTGQEMAAFFYRYAQLKQIDTTGSEEMRAQANALIQLHTLDAWALDCVVWALTGKMMDLSLVRPNEPATREDTAWFIYALLESLKD